MSRSSTLREDAPANRALRVLVATLLALIPLLQVMGASPASAATGWSGSLDQAIGFPSWYEDQAGDRVVPCLDPADTNCVLAGFTPTGPVSFPTNFPGEFFYTIADSTQLPTPGCKGTKRGTAFVRHALEGTFATADGSPAPLQQIVFARTRIRVDSGLCPNTAYQFVTPFGTTTMTADSAGAIKSGTVDQGCLAAPCAFGSPTVSPIFGSASVAGSGFLRWTSGAPAGYLGDAVTPHAVTGGTNGNLFEVRSSTGVLQPGMTTSLFTVSGKLAGSLVASSDSVDFGGQSVGSTGAARTVTVTNLDAASVTLAAPATSSTEFSVVPGGSCIAGTLLARDASCTVQMAFTAAEPLGAHTGTLTVASTGGVRSPLTVALKGTSITPTGTPVMGIDVTALDFPATRVREASPSKRVTVSNTGDAPLLVSDVRFDPSNANFRVLTDSCFGGSAGTTVAAGANCVIEVQFAPLSNGEHAATLELTTNAGSGSVALTGTGTGGSAAVGPVGAYGFPEWYRDDADQRLGQCNDPADSFCTVLADDTYTPAKPLVYPSNFPGEWFYYVTDAETPVDDPTCDTGVGNARFRAADEATFLSEIPGGSDQMTFGRIRYTARTGGLCPNTDYVFTSPYGADLFTTDAAGELRPTEDIGCGPTPAIPCDWEAALSSRVFASFVKWDPAVGPAAPVGYLGDAVTPHKITGAPYSPDGVNPANYFQISRQADGREVGRTDLFTVMGKLRGPLEATPSAVDFGAVQTQTPSPATEVTLTNTGTTPLDITALTVTGTNQGDFALTQGTCELPVTLLPGGTCTPLVTFTPAVNGPRAAAVTVTHTGANNPFDVHLSGVGQAEGTAAFTATPAAVTFGPIHDGTTSAVETVTVSNVGGVSGLEITDVALAGLEAPQFQIVDNTCLDNGAPVIVPVGGTCTVGVVFTPEPLEAGVINVALQFTDNGPGSPQDVTLTGTVSTATKAVSALRSSDNGFPMYYRDATGIRLEPCLDPVDTRCALPGFTPTGPVTFPGSFPTNFFYSLAESEEVPVAPIDGCTTTAGTAVLTLALQGTTALVPGDQATLGRIRVTGDDLCPSTAYTFVTPYGQVTATSDTGGRIANTSDIGATNPFAGALDSPVAASFPRWNPNVAPAAPAGYLGDAVTYHRIVGGTYLPAGASGAFNGFEVRDAADARLGGTDKFLVAGKLAASLHTTGTTLDFGNVNLNVTSQPKTVTLTNTGAPMAITKLVMSGTNPGDFIRGGTCAVNQSLATDEDCTVAVQFKPLAPTGTKTAQVTVTPASGAPIVIDLKGVATATGTAVASVSPAALAFGSGNVGTPRSLDVTMANTGTAPLTVNNVPTITGTAAVDYRVASTNCNPSTPVAPGSSCRITVTFTPGAAGVRSATLGIIHGAAGSPTAVALTGTGIAGTFTVTPVTTKFGKVTINTTKAGSVTVKNTGTIPFTVSTATITGAQATFFEVAASPNCLGAQLAAGRSCTINVTFRPLTLTNYTATLTVTGDASTPAKSSVALTGAGK